MKGAGRGVRITGGDLRGRLVRVPKTARPTEGRTREALFSIWSPTLEGARVLDLFAGSGVVGLEALSRGALEVVAVERDRRAAEELERLAKDLGVASALSVRRGELPTAVAAFTDRPFDLIYADPPYNWPRYPALLEATAPVLTPDGELVVEHEAGRDLPIEVGGLVRVDKRRYGGSGLSFYRRC